MRTFGLLVGFVVLAVTMMAPDASALPIAAERSPEVVDSPAIHKRAACRRVACFDASVDAPNFVRSVIEASPSASADVQMPTQSVGLIYLDDVPLRLAQWPKATNICDIDIAHAKCRKAIAMSVPEPVPMLLLAGGLALLILRRVA